MILLQIKGKEYPVNFIQQLKQYYLTQFMSDVDIKRLLGFENYFRETYQEEIDIYYVCEQAISNSEIISLDNGYNLIVNPNLSIRGFKFTNIVQLIDSGNLEIGAYPIFSNTKSDIEMKMDNLYGLYSIGVML